MIGTVEMGRGDQIASGVIGPAVEGTEKGFRVAEVRTTDGHPAVAAGVEEGLDRAIALPNDEDAIGTDVGGEEIAVIFSWSS